MVEIVHPVTPMTAKQRQDLIAYAQELIAQGQQSAAEALLQLIDIAPDAVHADRIAFDF